MKFLNKTGEGKKVRIENKHPFPPDWKTIKDGEEVDISEHYGKNLGFTPVKVKKPVPDNPKGNKKGEKKVKPKESKAGPAKIETKEIDEAELKEVEKK